MKRRSLKSQLNYVISQNFVPGVSKRGDKKNEVDTAQRIYSNKTASKLRDTSNMLADWLKNNHPEIKMIRDLNPEIVQNFCHEKEKDWSWSTRTEMISRLKKIQSLAKKTYPGSNISFTDHLDQTVFSQKKVDDKIRNIAMTRQDYNKINNAMENSRSKAKFSVHLAAATGARVEEICSLKPDRIDVIKDQVTLTNCKNGRNRTVGFDPKERAFFENLIDHCRKNNWETVTGGLKPAAVSRQVRRQINKLYKSGELSQEYRETSIHAVRKMAARERLAAECGIPVNQLSSVSHEQLKKGWLPVQKILGHGCVFRNSLFETYIGFKI